MDITLYRYQLPLSQPIQFHEQQLTVREGLLLKWGSSWGEIAPLPGFSRETLAEAQAEAAKKHGFVTGILSRLKKKNDDAA